MALRTYGTKPKSFQVEKNGEYYCMGSEVGNYLGFFRGTLYKKYPRMFRRSVTNNERKKLIKLGLNPYVPTSIVCLVRASEVEDIIEGNDHKYKPHETPSVHSNKPTASRNGKSKKPVSRVSNLPNSSHLDAARQATSMIPNRAHNNVTRTFLPRFSDMDHSANLGIGLLEENLVPTGLDRGIHGQEIRDNFTWENNAKQDSRKDYVAIATAVEDADIADNLAQYELTYNYDCRICLKSSEKFWEIFQIQNLPQKIMEIAYVKVQYGDGLPSVICFACRQLLEMFHDFKCLIEKSDAALRNALLSRMEISQDTVTKSLSQPIHNDFQMHCESQLLAFQNFHHMISNDYDSKRNLAAYQIHKECLSNNKRSHKEEVQLENKDNELDDQKYIGKTEVSSEPGIIAISENSKILRENQGRPTSTVLNSGSQSAESEMGQIKEEELLLPEGSDISEGENNHQFDETFCHNNFEIESKKKFIFGRVTTKFTKMSLLY